MDIFDRFNQEVDVAGLAEDAKAASERGDFAEVPLGTYQVELNKLELKESSNHNPMVSAWFKITEGEHAKQMIFYNQVINQGFQIHLANEFLRSMDTGDTVEFKDYRQYNDLLMDIAEHAEGLEFALEYGKGKNDFKTYKITEVFE